MRGVAMAHAAADRPECWPALPLSSWKDTYATLHMWTEIVGKVRLRLTPLVNHWWNVPLYVTARGLTTSGIAYGDRAFELRFDFIGHELVLETSDGQWKTLPLKPRPVAEFYQEFIELLRSAGIEVKIWRMPAEIPDPIAFDQDRVHASYDPKAVEKFWRILLSVDTVQGQIHRQVQPSALLLGKFRSCGHRFSGRRAPERPGADSITREAYSHEVSSVGFWPGSGNVQDAAFYSYAAPEPLGLKDERVRPDGAFYDRQLGEFLLMYDDVRKAESPTATLLEFCESTYEAAATLGNWDRRSLER
jgi:hypothetical protein